MWHVDRRATVWATNPAPRTIAAHSAEWVTVTRPQRTGRQDSGPANGHQSDVPNCYNLITCTLLFKSNGIFFQTQKSYTYTLSIDLKNYKHQYEMFCDIYTRFDKISQSRYGSVTTEIRPCSKNALQNLDAGVTYKRNTSVGHNSL